MGRSEGGSKFVDGSTSNMCSSGNRKGGGASKGGGGGCSSVPNKGLLERGERRAASNSISDRVLKL
jgi:hypothetical protein